MKYNIVYLKGICIFVQEITTKTNIMSHAQKIQLENLSGLKIQMNYSSDVLLNRINEMEDWEVKEYISVHLDTQAEYNELFLHVTQNF